MKSLDKLVLRGSAIRTRLSELGGDAELTDETRSEIDTLRGEYGDVERKTQAAMISEDTPKIETHDASRSDLAGRANVGEVFSAALEHRSATGATAELQEELGLQSNQVPVELLSIETRAVTPSPSDTQANQSEIVPYVFPGSVHEFLGIATPTVPVGEAVYPVLTATTDVHTPIENAAAAETTGSFSADVLSPARIQAAFYYSRESRAKFAGMDSALRMNLSDALADGLDQQILNGANGLMAATNLPNNNASAVTTFANYVSQFGYGRVDGRYASTTGDLRIVMGSTTYAHAGTTYRHQNADDVALERLMAITGGVRVSAHVPAAASNKQNAVIRLGMRMDAVAPLWEGVTLIEDSVTKSSMGQIQITAVLLFALKILRKDGFRKQQTQHS